MVKEGVKKYSKLAVFSFVLILIWILIIYPLMIYLASWFPNISSSYILLIVFIIPIISIIISIISLIIIKKNNLGGKNFAISSIIISIFILLLIFGWQFAQYYISQPKPRPLTHVCLDLQLSIVKATAGNGTCRYAAGGACVAYTLTKVLDGLFCPTPKEGCTLIDGPYPTPDATKPGYVTVTRDSVSGNENPVNVALFVNYMRNPSTTNNSLANHESALISIIGLNVSDEIKVAPLVNNKPCPITDTELTKSP